MKGPTGPVTDSGPLYSNNEQRCEKQMAEKCKLKCSKGQRGGSAIVISCPSLLS